MKTGTENRPYFKPIPLLLLILLAFAGGAVLHGASAADDHAAGGPPPGPMPVVVEVIKETPTQIWTEYSGRLSAVDYVELRPQVTGTVTDIKFEDGQDVAKGDVLYVIDPAPYEAAVAQANADLSAAKSQAEFAQKQLDRAKGLMETNAISKDLLDERTNSARVAKNNIDAANARLRDSKINLDRAYVKAPIAGRVGRAEITEGNLVQAGPNAPILTTILSNAEIYADFDVDEQTYLLHVRGQANGIEGERAVPVKLTLKGDAKATYEGKIQSFDNRINTATGTIRARALFANSDGALLPGMFVNVKMGTPVNENKILVSERIISTDQDRKFVYVVNDSNKVEYREVKLGATMNGQRVVLDGLKPGEKVITEGIMRIRPDMDVAPQEAAAKEAAKDLGKPPVAADAEPAAEAGAGEAPPENLVPPKE